MYESMKNKKCIITGASSGLGKEIALGLAALDAELILICRDVNRGKKTVDEIISHYKTAKINLLIADLSSNAAIKKVSQILHEQYSNIDVLINNAGVVELKKQYSNDHFELTLATNYLGPILLTHFMIDLLKASQHGRIINVSSDVHRYAKLDLNDLQFDKRPYRGFLAYGQSKLLLNLYTFELARRLGHESVTVNCFHPGAVKTNLGSSNAHNMVLKLLDKMVKLFFISPKKAAQTAIYLASSSELSKTTGQYFVKSKPVAASATSNNLELAKSLWELTHKWLDLPA